MKKMLRYIVILPIVLPFVVFVQIARVFVGKQKAVDLCAPLIISVAKFFLKIAVPHIERPEDFSVFRAKFKDNFWLWSPLYDFEVAEENEDLIRLNVRNCPFCELFQMSGLNEMNRHVCQGDWKLAREYEHVWKFERAHEIGKGDAFCDHTYLRLKERR